MAPSSPSISLPRKSKKGFVKKIVGLKPRRPRLKRPRKSSTAFQRQPPRFVPESPTDVEMTVESLPMRPCSPPRVLLEETNTVCLTPRANESLMDETSASLTPPSANPAPLIVSAKRLHSEIRQSHSKRRRGGRFSPPSAKENGDSWSWREPFGEDDSSVSSGACDDLGSLQGLSPEEKSKHYWEYCYGTNVPQPLSSNKTVPIKSCLSSSKRYREVQENSHQTPSSRNRCQTPVFHTPTSSPEEQVAQKVPNGKSIQFGYASAIEFEREEPPNKFTPIPSEEAQKCFTLEEKKITEEEEELTEETKRNSAILQEWDDFHDSDEEEELAPIRNRRRRRSSFFSPSAGSAGLLLPGDAKDDTVDATLTLSTLVVQSPDAKISPNLVSDTSNSVEDDSLMKESPPKNQGGSPIPMSIVMSPSQTFEDTTPPSNLRLGSINSSGGALISTGVKTSPMELPNRGRQLSDALEQCADDHLDIIDTLLKDPKEEQEWPLSVVLGNMARHASLLESNSNVYSESLNQDFAVETLIDINVLSQALISTSQNFLKLNPPSQAACTPHAEEGICVLQLQNAQVQLIKQATAQIANLGDSCDAEIATVEQALMQMPSRRRQLHNGEISKQGEQLARIQNAIALEREQRNLAEALLALELARQAMEANAPISILGCIAASEVASFSLDEVSDEYINCSFHGVVPNCYMTMSISGEATEIEGESCRRIDAQIVSTPGAINRYQGVVPVDGASMRFYQMLLCGPISPRDGPLDQRCSAPLSQPVLRQIQSPDLGEIFLDASIIFGNIDSATIDLMRAQDEFDCEIEVEYDAGDNIVIVTISLPIATHVVFEYHRDEDKCIYHCLPTHVTVLDGDERVLEHPQQIAQSVLSSTEQVSCFQRTLDEVCRAIDN